MVSRGARGAETSRLGGDLPAEHHRVVLVRQVVAVRHVGAHEVPEAAVDDHRLTRVERTQVSPRLVVPVPGTAVACRHALAVAHHGAVSLYVEVEGMHPAAAPVA